MWLLKLILKYILGLFGIVLISCIPGSFENQLEFNALKYFETVGSVLYQLVTPSEWHYRQFVSYDFTEKPLFSFIMDNYVYSMTILFSALLIAMILGFSFALITFQMPRKMKGFTMRVLNFFEAFPDVHIIFLLQIFIIWFYKQFDILLFRFVSFGGEKAYLSPIIALAILPTILFFKVILFLLEEEWNKSYVDLARSKGFSKGFIMIRHCLKNIQISLFIQSKPIIWGTLSSLMVVEYLHNIYGIIQLIFFDTRPFIISVSLIMIFTPFFLLYNVMEELLKIRERNTFDYNARLFRSTKTFSYGKVKFTSVNLHKFKKLFNSFLNLCRKPKFLLGMTYVFGMLITSLLYGIFQGDKVDRKMVFRDENDVLHRVPHDPGFFLLGSDYHGFSVLDMLLVGAKYTIIFTILIAFLQILFGYLLTIPYMFWLGERSKSVINKIADGMQFLPITLLAYILLLETVVFSEKNKAVAESLVVPNIVLQVAVITLLSLPIMLNSLGNEANSILKKEHIQSSILLGASKSHIFFKHITTHLKPKIILLFYQQLIRVLVVFVHLGVFGIFLGGGIRVPGKPPTSLTYEWTTLFANLRDGIITGQYWVVYPVLILYLLLIFSFQAISKSLIEEEQHKVGAYSDRMM